LIGLEDRPFDAVERFSWAETMNVNLVGLNDWVTG
jgi:hypothetical protein